MSIISIYISKKRVDSNEQDLFKNDSSLRCSNFKIFNTMIPLTTCGLHRRGQLVKP